MPSGIEVYDEKKKALRGASAELAVLKDKLDEIVKALTLFPRDLLEPQSHIRYPIKDDGSVDYPDDLEAPTKLDLMPEKVVIREAITKLRKCETGT